MNKENPLVSVCVQTYNQENYIMQCLEGILIQETDFDFEIILGEDESTDRTREICIEYADKHPNQIKLFLRSRKDVIYINGNPTGRYNFIENLKACQGKYIALCEGDDYWTDPLKLQKQVDFLENNVEYTGCFHDTSFINENDSIINFNLLRTYDKSIFHLKDTLSTISLFHTSSFLFRRSSLIIPKWFKKIQSADMALFAIIADNGLLNRIGETMSVYRKHTGGLTNKIKEIEYHKNRIILFKKLKRFLKNKENDQIIRVIEFHRKNLSNIARRI